MTARIKAIDNSTVHRICSGQVILDLATAVKELVENSLDAGATVIEIKFKEHGIDSVEVSDNGSGIDPQDYETLALKHHTSKITSFEDLAHINTFGFRGEALSSLCALGQLTVLTCTNKQAPCGVRLEYDTSGRLVESSPVAREQGTTIQLKRIFESLPVRHREFKRNIKREFGKSVYLIQAYALISCNVRFMCSTQSSSISGKSNDRSKIISTNGNKLLRENVANIFGAKQLQSLTELDVEINIPCSSRTAETREETRKLEDAEYNNYSIRVVGLVSKPLQACGRSSADRQYYFVNGRPCTLPKIVKLLNEVYRSFNNSQYPFVIADFQMPTWCYDINVTPDKRVVLLHNEQTAMEKIREQLTSLFEPFRRTFAVQIPPLEFSENVSPPISSNVQKPGRNDSSPSTQGETVRTSPLASQVTPIISATDPSIYSGSPNKGSVVIDEETSSDIAVNEKVEERNGESCPSKTSIYLPSASPASLSMSTSNVNHLQRAFAFEEQVSKVEANLNNKSSIETSTTLQPTLQQWVTTQTARMTKSPEEVNHKFASTIRDANSEIEAETVDTLSTIPRDVATPSLENLRNHEDGQTPSTLVFDIDSTRKHFEQLQRQKYLNFNQKSHGALSQKPIAAGLNASQDVAENELNRVLTKSDFSSMTVIGQFNYGFIITRLNTSQLSGKPQSGCQYDGDLYIIDQHASDEKYNFELLQENSVIKSQKLIRKRVLELTAEQELIAMDNLDILRKNGFEIIIDDDAPPTRKLQLLSVPVNKSMTFGVEDLEELIWLLNEHPSRHMVRPSKLRAAFASRACRKSVMIGDALSLREMKKIVGHMGEIDQPWNCPHGRPTMRHLFDLRTLPKMDEPELKWRNFRKCNQ
ncbi:uncharacterized protein VTP21DRAFT_2367 [Calcarisporiella thermophila]|uniref:uncharacterized protein n=1 Tax=Calcarisporiella thermophila TaxID=911321 RepID=UPI003744100C